MDFVMSFVDLFALTPRTLSAPVDLCFSSAPRSPSLPYDAHAPARACLPPPQRPAQRPAQRQPSASPSPRGRERQAIRTPSPVQPSLAPSAKAAGGRALLAELRVRALAPLAAPFRDYPHLRPIAA